HGHDHHAQVRGALALKGRVDQAVEEVGEAGTERGPRHEPEPDGDPALVQRVGHVGAGDHDLAVREVDHVGDAELHGEAHRPDGDHGKADEPEPEGRGDEAHGADETPTAGGRGTPRPYPPPPAWMIEATVCSDSRLICCSSPVAVYL